MTIVTYHCDDEAIYVGECARIPTVMNPMPSDEEVPLVSQKVRNEMNRVPYLHLFSPSVLRHIATVYLYTAIES